MSTPKNEKLYKQVVAKIKQEYDVFPSAYASMAIVKEYKRLGGTYKGRRSESNGTSRWVKEKWIDVCQLPKKVPCGRKRGGSKRRGSKRAYPYCRPSKRINAQTPKTYKEISKSELVRRCSKKKKRPSQRIR